MKLQPFYLQIHYNILKMKGKTMEVETIYNKQAIGMNNSNLIHITFILL